MKQLYFIILLLGLLSFSGYSEAGNKAEKPITVHEVLTNNFWSGDRRPTTLDVPVDLNRVTKYKYLRGGFAHRTEQPEYVKRVTGGGVLGKDKAGHRKWKIGSFFKGLYYRDPKKESRYNDITIDLKTPFSRQKQEAIRTENSWKYNSLIDDYTTRTNTTETVYACKPKKGRPVGPYTENWFEEALKKPNAYCDYTILNTEHNAITNIVSDNEAYISGSIYQTGTYNEIAHEEAGWSTWLDQSYTQNVSIQSLGYEKEEREYYSEYTATFKKSKCKSETETITRIQKAEYRDEFVDLLKRKREQDSN